MPSHFLKSKIKEGNSGASVFVIFIILNSKNNSVSNIRRECKGSDFENFSSIKDLLLENTE